MQSTMQDFPLTVAGLYRRGRDFFSDSEIVTWEGDRSRRATFAAVAERAERLAAALKRLGVRPGERVATLAWNNQEHQEAYLAVPGMGAVLHTLNLRLPPEQLAWVVNHAADRVILVDQSLLPLLEGIQRQLTTVEQVIVLASPEYERLLEAETEGFDWPELDERAAASICYTTGTTGDPKGVVYSHRSLHLHSLAQWGAFSLAEQDRLLVIVPMFHVNAWGFPYTAWMLGADLLMPNRHLQAEPLARFIEQERPTVAFGVPTIWNDLLQHVDRNPTDLSSLRLVVCGGSAVPRSLMEQFQARHGVRVIQAWGMTETSPVAAIAFPPKGIVPETEIEWRAKTGRVVAGVELRIVGETGDVLPADGASVGEIEVRGPWITGSYYRVDAPERFDAGWLRTGDVGHLDRRGFVQITDRTKDVIKSGGEWISSVELETALAAHPDVLEATVVGVPDERWQERPLAVVRLRDGALASPEVLAAFLAGRVARWWVPERWAFVGEVPKTSVGKYDKKRVRAMYAAGELEVAELAA
ncbi:MAG TPA: long-chain fatty acid--CoA ligase, partial [Candidatus Dormibacteraeota bacterium]